MTNTRQHFLFSIIVLLLLLPWHSVLAQTGGTYDLSWHTNDSGGGTSSGGTYSISGTTGQLDAGDVMTGSTYEVHGGFWVASTSTVILEISVNAVNDDIEIDWIPSGSDLYNVYFGYTPNQDPFDPLPGAQGILPPVYHQYALIDGFDYFYNVEPVVKK